MGIDWEGMSETYDTAVHGIDARLEQEKRVFESRQAEYERDPAADYDIEELPYYIKYRGGGDITVFMTETEDEISYTEKGSFAEKLRAQQLFTKEFTAALEKLDINYSPEIYFTDEKNSVEMYLKALQNSLPANKELQNTMIKFMSNWLSSYYMSEFIKNEAAKAREKAHTNITNAGNEYDLLF